MTACALAVREDSLVVTWSDGNATAYPTIWLRDNCPSGFHPQTQERLLDLLTIEPNPRLLDAECTGETVALRYADGHLSHFALDFLDQHRPGQPAPDPAVIPPRRWRADLSTAGIPRFRSADIIRDDAVLRSWLEQTLQTGLSIVDGLSAAADAGMAVAQRIGFLRQTNFGTTFEVVSMPDPNNLAYTAVELPLHTDLPNQEVPPGFQFLHCIANAAQGGGSVFADGFAIAEDLRAEDPAAFALLCDIAIPFRFHDAGFDIRKHAPVITLGAAGEVGEIRYNAHIAAVFDMPAEIMPAYYRAYRAFMAKTREPRYRLSFKLNAGEMVVFDNRRVLHGREAFDPASGFRHLHGCYVDRGEYLSRLRRLASG